MKRNMYKLSTIALLANRVGCLNTIHQLPVMAGDSINLKMSVMMRLSPLRRVMIVEPQVDFFAFFVPNRHIYGDSWKRWIAGGVKENVTLDSVTLPEGIDYLGINPGEGNIVVPLTTLAGYNRIFNRYFKIPSDKDTTIGYGDLADDYILPNDFNRRRQFGQRCAHLQTQWNTGVVDRVADADRQVPISGGVLDLTDLAKQKGLYGTEQARNFFANADERYTDFMKMAFDTSVNSDADERPTLIMHDTHFISGKDIDGTGGDDSLGQSTGKGAGVINFGFPTRFFPEHGNVIIMSLVRYPPLFYHETNRLLLTPNPSYKVGSGDPRLLVVEPPEELDLKNYFAYSATTPTNAGLIPYGNWLRAANACHASQAFQDLQGYPIFNPSNIADNGYIGLHYVDPNLYEQIFSTTAQGHAQLYCQLDFMAKRLTPTAANSIFAGTN